MPTADGEHEDGGGVAERRQAPGEHDREHRDAHPDGLRPVLDQEGDQGDHCGESEQVPRTEDALDRAELRDVALDAENSERHVEQNPREDLDTERDRQQHAHDVAECAGRLQGVADVPDRHGEERETRGRDPPPEGARGVLAPEHAHQRPRDEQDHRRRHQSHERDLLPACDEDADAEHAEPDEDRDVGDTSGDPLDREGGEDRPEYRQCVGPREGGGCEEADPAPGRGAVRRVRHDTCVVSSPRSIAMRSSAAPSPTWGDCLILYASRTTRSHPHSSSGLDSARP